MLSRNNFLFTCFFTILNVSLSNADVRLPAVIGDNMVVQQNEKVPLWGWADPGENIHVQGSWQRTRISTQADEKGRWRVRLKTPKAGGPHTISIRGKNTVVLRNVLAGEVWLCSGQSNMGFTVQRGSDAKNDIAAANFPEIRLFQVAKQYAAEPQMDCTGTWQACDSSTVKNFSAVAYFFGRELYRMLKVPVGLIHSSWGGMPAESWTRREILEKDPELGTVFLKWKEWLEQAPADEAVYNRKMETWKKEAETAKTKSWPLPHEPGLPVSVYMMRSPHREPAVLYNGMVAPLIPLAIKGVIWYQGESNRDRPIQYRKLFQAMIANWRSDWGRGDFPFYYVQIAPYAYDTHSESIPLLREAQAEAMSLPNTGMAVTMDVGNPDDIHPANKQDVGKRLALWALAKTYGRKGFVYSGPLYKTMNAEGNKIRLHFDHAGSGLAVKGDSLSRFLIAGDDKCFFSAKAVIDGKTVLVWSNSVTNPRAVRYGWGGAPEANLFNNEGLPAAPFRTDGWDDACRIYRVGIRNDFSYLPPDRPEKMDLYVPLDNDAYERFPGVVIIHGGGWTGGDKARKREIEIGTALAAQGYVCASINYLLAGKSKPAFPQNVHDCKAAVRFLRANAREFGIDPDRIGVIGGSAGGHLALMLGVTGPEGALEPENPYPGVSSRVQAVVDLYGPSDLLTRQKTDSSGNPTGRRYDGSAATTLGATREQNEALWRQASPVTHVTPGDPPVLILHGKSDTTVDYAQSIEMAEKLSSAGVPVELHLLEGVGHTFALKVDVNGKPLPQDLRPIVIGFFDKYLKSENPGN